MTEPLATRPVSAATATTRQASESAIIAAPDGRSAPARAMLGFSEQSRGRSSSKSNAPSIGRGRREEEGSAQPSIGGHLAGGLGH
ncbi:MAG TPA: hypothetical protein VMA77_06925 [Solirubrobacteraceae bacterium]|nr:hypothetical protein [Solirubrobacteraceae bacterium]